MVIKNVALLCLALCSATARIRHGETDKCPPLDPNWEDKLDELFLALPADFPERDSDGSFSWTPTLILGSCWGTQASAVSRVSSRIGRMRRSAGTARGSSCSASALRSFSNCPFHGPSALDLTGSIRAVAPLSRIEGQILVTKTEGARKWVLESLEMVRLERQYITVDGMGSGVKTVMALGRCPDGWDRLGCFG
uniref:Putative secreted protein n=1 Tax=Ixodes ricinus TaxID=34613 RepID=A0A090X9J2_IXORI